MFKELSVELVKKVHFIVDVCRKILRESLLIFLILRIHFINLRKKDLRGCVFCVHFVAEIVSSILMDASGYVKLSV